LNLYFGAGNIKPGKRISIPIWTEERLPQRNFQGQDSQEINNSAIHAVSAQASNLWMSFALKCWSSIMSMVLTRFPSFAYSARKEIHEMQLCQPSEKNLHVPRTVGQQSITR
jgi:hypothetical protein